MIFKLKSMAMALAMTTSALVLAMTEVRASNEDGIKNTPQNSRVLRTRPLQKNPSFSKVDGTEEASFLKKKGTKPPSKKKSEKHTDRDYTDRDFGSDPHKKVQHSGMGSEQRGSDEENRNDIETEEQMSPEEVKGRKPRGSWTRHCSHETLAQRARHLI